MKKYAICLLAVMLMLAACGNKAETKPAVATAAQQVQEETTQAAPETEAETVAEPLPEETEAESEELEYAGIYEHPYSEEIGGTLVERSLYIILNEDHTGYWIIQAVGMLTWDENQLTQEIGAVNDFTLSKKDGKVVLNVYDFQDENGNWTSSEYVKIDELPAEIEELIALELEWRANL